MYKKELIRKLQTRDAVIGIVGMGYVGLPLALRFSEVGYKVIGFENDVHKVNTLNAGKSCIKYIPDQKVADMVASGSYVTSDYSDSANADALIICVPTPLDKNMGPDLSYIMGSVDSIAPYLCRGQVLTLESTTYHGTTRDKILPTIKKRGFDSGDDFFLVYSPEREDPGNADFSTQTIPKICGGHTPSCLEVGIALYEQVVDQVVPVSSTEAAELTKLLENIHRAVNIGLVNEMKILSDRMDIDIYEVIRAAATKPFGFTAYYPGPGLGGHCIPIDPFYLTWKAKEYGLHTKFIELAGEINNSMPAYVIDKVTRALNDNGKAVNGARVTLIGVSYKKNIDDVRETPASEIVRELLSRGADVAFIDPHVKEFSGEAEDTFCIGATEFSEDVIRDSDCIVVVTDHDDIDYDLIAQHAQVIVDSRGRYDPKQVNVVAS